MALDNEFERKLLGAGVWEPLSTILSTESPERTSALGKGVKEFSSYSEIPVGFVGTARVGTALYVGDGTSLQQVKGMQNIGDAPIFYAPLRTSTATSIPGTTETTVTFSRAFNLSILDSTGIWTDAAHLTAGFSYVPDADRYMLAGAGNGAGVDYAAIGPINDPQHRNFTDAIWVKTTLTAANNQVGIDGVANSASSLTATGNLAKCLVSTTSTAVVRTFQVFIKRLAGYGRIWLTTDGGTSYTDVTSQIITTKYTQVAVQTSGAANTSCGIQLEYINDSIAVDCANIVSSTTKIPPLMKFPNSVRTQSLVYSDAKSNTASKSFSLECSLVYDNSPGFSLQLANTGGFGLLSASVISASKNFFHLQFSTSNTNVFYHNVNPDVLYESVSLKPGVTYNFKVLHAGGVFQMFINNVLVSLYDKPFTLVNSYDMSVYKDLLVNVASGNYISEVKISEWYGDCIAVIGDSLSATESWRQSISLAWPVKNVVVMRGQGGDTVAGMLARIPADLTYSMPSTNNPYVIMRIGTNSLANNLSPASCLIDLQSSINATKAINANVKIILVTVLTYRTAGLTGLTAAQFKTNAIAFNSGMNTLTGFYKVVDINIAGVTDQASFYSDGIHVKYKYNPMIARMITAAY